MAQLTVANMRAVAQELVLDTSSANPGLATADWLILLNDALFQYAAMFPNLLPLSGLLATASLTQHSATATLTLSGLTAPYRNITDAVVRGSAVPMERAEVLDLFRMFAADATEGTPSRWAIFSSAPGQSTAMVYTARFWRIADAAYSIDFYGTVQPVALTGDSDTTLFQDAEARTIARIAALEGARLLGRSPDFINSLASRLPDAVKAKLYALEVDTRPREVEGKAIV